MGDSPLLEDIHFELETATVSSLSVLLVVALQSVFIYLCGCFACMHAMPCVPGACAGLERSRGALELQLETITSHHMGAGNKNHFSEKQPEIQPLLMVFM